MYENGKADFANYLNFVVSKKARVVEIYFFDTKAIKEGLFIKPRQQNFTSFLYQP